MLEDIAHATGVEFDLVRRYYLSLGLMGSASASCRRWREAIWHRYGFFKLMDVLSRLSHLPEFEGA